MKNPDEDYAYSVRKQAEIDAYDDAKWAQLIGQSTPAVVRRPQRFVRYSGFKPEDFQDAIRIDRQDKFVAWTLVFAAIVILAVTFGEWMP